NPYAFAVRPHGSGGRFNAYDHEGHLIGNFADKSAADKAAEKARGETETRWAHYEDARMRGQAPPPPEQAQPEPEPARRGRGRFDHGARIAARAAQILTGRKGITDMTGRIHDRRAPTLSDWEKQKLANGEEFFSEAKTDHGMPVAHVLPNGSEHVLLTW